MATASGAYNTIIFKSRTLKSSSSSSSKLQNYPLLPFIIHGSPSLSSSKLPFPLSRDKLAICSVAKIIPQQVELDKTSSDSSPSIPDSSWSEFASKVSGEWDGFGADFTTEGKPIELPESVVPEAYREWDVKVFDWQTQCPTLADPQSFLLSYRSIKLLPTVGCEADAATIYSTEERHIGSEEASKNILAFSFQNTGCYATLWQAKENGEAKMYELEHCLIDPRDKESRVRVIQVLHLKNSKLELQKIRVFCEQWYGPFRNGDQLGGCSIRDSAFASTAALSVSDVTGVWQSCDAVASYQISENKVFQELVGGSTKKIVRNERDLIMLPRQLWSSVRETGNGETCGEVGWLLDREFAITSRCIFLGDGNLKEISVGHETAAVN